MVMHAELAAAAVAILAAAAEKLHAGRCRRLARLAFGPDRQARALGAVRPRAPRRSPRRALPGDWSRCSSSRPRSTSPRPSPTTSGGMS